MFLDGPQTYWTLVSYPGDGDGDTNKACDKCHSDPAVAGEESQINFEAIRQEATEMFESLASCFAFRCSASLNMTASEVLDVCQSNIE